MIELCLKNTIDRLNYTMSYDMFYLLNKNNIMLSNNIKNNIINYAFNKNLTVIYNDFTNHILIKKSNNHNICKDYDFNRWNINYFKYKKVIINH